MGRRVNGDVVTEVRLSVSLSVRITKSHEVACIFQRLIHEPCQGFNQIKEPIWDALRED